MSDWLCEWFSAGCPDHGALVSRSAPEISSGALLLGVALVVGVVAIVQHERTKRRGE
jgi:hypothetical protein